MDSESLNGGAYDERANVLTLSGEWDFAGKDALRTLTARLHGSPAATIDLCGVRFMDSSVINEIFRTYKRLAAEGATLRLVVADERIERLLQITQVDQVMEVSRRV
ncbi:MAG: STAS domain-containing protein [Candidatus Tumulicola sp.]